MTKPKPQKVFNNKSSNIDEKKRLGQELVEFLSWDKHGDFRQALGPMASYSAYRMVTQQNPSVNERNSKGWTPLMLAAYFGHKQLVEAIIERGADLNAQDVSKSTAMMRALLNPDAMNIVYLLLEKGADPRIQDISGTTAIVYAAERSESLAEAMKKVAERLNREENKDKIDAYDQYLKKGMPLPKGKVPKTKRVGFKKKQKPHTP